MSLLLGAADSPHRFGHVSNFGHNGRMDAVPRFRYHPDPIGTGSVRPSNERCEVCGRISGNAYIGPVYSAMVDSPVVCIGCVADGTAAARWTASFTDGHPWAANVSEEIADEVLTRTPGFSGWQQEQWMVHCDDAAIFLGPVGAPELARFPAGATEALRDDLATSTRWPAAEIAGYISSLQSDGMPTGYLFQCRHCETFLGYTDSL